MVLDVRYVVLRYAQPSVVAAHHPHYELRQWIVRKLNVVQLCATAIAGLLDSFGILRTHGVVGRSPDLSPSMLLRCDRAIMEICLTSSPWASRRCPRCDLQDSPARGSSLRKVGRDEPGSVVLLFTMIGCAKDARVADWSRLWRTWS